jgi:hypothetical protein
MLVHFQSRVYNFVVIGIESSDVVDGHLNEPVEE